MSHEHSSRYRILLPAAALAFALLSGSATPVAGQWSAVAITPLVHVTTSFGVWDAPLAVVELPDGRFVAGGYTGDNMPDLQAEIDIALARYMPDGTLDPTFGNAGKVTSDFGIHAQIIYDLALQPDGKLLAAGGMYSLTGFESYMVIARYLPDGQLDVTFGTGGHTVLDPANRERDTAFAVALQPDGRIVLAGATDRDVAVIRLTADGALDAGFGLGGVSRPARTVKQALDVTVQPDGKLLVVGTTKSSPTDMVAMRLDDKGNLDPSFAAGGTAVLSLGHGGPYTTNGRGVAIGVLSDGRVQAAGETNADHHVARLQRDGSMDMSFGDRGQLRYDLYQQSNDFTEAMVIRPDDSTLVMSQTVMDPSSGGDPGIGLALLDPHGALDPRIGTRAAPGVGFVGSVRSTTLRPASAASLGLDRAVVASSQISTSGRVRNSDFAMTIVGLPAIVRPPTATATATQPTETATATSTRPTATATATPTPTSASITSSPTPSQVTPTASAATPSATSLAQTPTPSPITPTAPVPQWTIFLPLTLPSSVIH